jgi:hypothetical protein
MGGDSDNPLCPPKVLSCEWEVMVALVRIGAGQADS